MAPSTSKQAPAPRSIAILAFPETTASVVHGLHDLFRGAGRDWGVVVDGKPGPELLASRIVSCRGAIFDVANGVPIRPHATFEEARDDDVVCVPEIALPPDMPIAGRFTREVEWIRACHDRGATIATACSGAVLLAEAGLLDGLEATTHWAYCDVMRERHPRVKLRPHSALVVAGEGQRLVMAGGGTSWLDLGLYLIARTAGVEAAMQVARINLIDWHDIGQQPFARLASSRQVADAAVSEAQAWIASHYREPNPVARMVEKSGLAERTFKRRFQAATGMAPLEYAHALRIEAAKELLEARVDPIELVAEAVGYEDAGFFARLFKRSVNLTPAQYRKRFGALRKALER